MPLSLEEFGFVDEDSVDPTVMADLAGLNGRGFYRISFEVADLMVVTSLNQDLVVFNCFAGH